MVDSPAAPRLIRGFDFVFFDCDSTLSAIEGIDELARLKGRYGDVTALTDAAMAGEIPLEEVYSRRLEMLSPSESEVASLASLYIERVVPDTREVIGALTAAEKEVFIVSGGLLPAVRPFGRWLGVPDGHIRAVDLAHTNPDEEPLRRTHGKAIVAQDLLSGRSGRSMLVGDGASDLAAREAVDLFVGFTGMVERPLVVAESEVLIAGASLAPVLGLALTESEEAALSSSAFHGVIEESRARIEAGEVVVRKDGRP